MVRWFGVVLLVVMGMGCNAAAPGAGVDQRGEPPALDVAADTQPDTQPDTLPDTQPDTQPDTLPDTLPDTPKDTLIDLGSDTVDLMDTAADVVVDVVELNDAVTDLPPELPPDISPDTAVTSELPSEVIEPPPSELVAWYRFEDPDQPQIQDASLFGNHGDPAPELLRGVEGKVGMCVRFDGADANVVIPDSESLDLTDKLTLEAWVYLDTPDNQNKMLLRKYLQYQMSISVVPQAGLLEFYSQPLGFAHANELVDFGRWVHVAVSWDGATARFYLDGILADETPMAGAVESKGLTLYLGGDGLNGNSPMGGIDEVKIWSVVRSEQEICGDGTGAWVPDVDPPCVY